YLEAGRTELAYGLFCEAAGQFLKDSQTEEAMGAYLRALEINPCSHECLAPLAYLYVQLGEAERAIQMVKSIADRQAEDPELRVLLADLYRSAGQPDAAEALLQVKQFKDAQPGRVLDAAEQFFQSGDLDSAAGEIHSNLEELLHHGRAGEAAEFLQRILLRDGHHVVSLSTLAEIYRQSGRWPELIPVLERLSRVSLLAADEGGAIGALKELSLLAPQQETYRKRL